ncbi:protein FAM8A1 isoform X1 [Ischnura elegans]|uniref:protein FAM8A1 isoform X1 n=1 Tax=Ischnura elegans TaxID=197161 RepID=UPI001ED88D63|nr:protein FAM8A1 isoform X1 [Ischnura elegans]
MEPPSNEDKSASDKVKSQKSHQPTYENTAEYINALEKWLQEAYMWQCVSAWFPYMLMSHQLSGSRGEFPFGSFDRSNGVFSFIPNVIPTTASSSRDGNNVGFHNTATSGIRRQEDQGVIYKIPPLWKRFVAEFLDFLLLFSAKLLITIVAVDFLDVIDLDKYDLDHLQQNDEFDYQMAIDMLSELFLLELVHNFVACLFEAMCIYRGSNGRLGGATPGKSIMGLRVVMSDHIVPVSYPVGQQSGNREGTYVRVHPGSDLGFWWALCRSLVKNFCLAFFFPVCITMFFSNHNRTAYDNISHSLVVEEIPRHQN